VVALPTPLPLPLDYPVYCASGTLRVLHDIVAQHARAHRIAVISDETVAALYGATVLAQFPADSTRLFTIPPGEHEKTRERWAELTDALFAWGAGRDTTVVALGGGVVGDLAGFVAATFMRGIPVVQVPTTLLAMVDASVGGKTAIDTAYGKNLVGAFHNPSAVVMDPQLLTTLPADQVRSGMAEIIKHGIIADTAYFDLALQALPEITELGGSAPSLLPLIAGSVHIKADVVAEDTREGGLRQILNFGHTIAHAIERELAYRISHGDAVAIGMVAEARLAEEVGVARTGLHVAIRDALIRAGLPVTLPPNVSAAAVVRAASGDKKSRSGSARYALPRAIGEMEAAEGHWSVSVSDEIVLKILLSAA
jgi:3-dehydroquinate synthase